MRQLQIMSAQPDTGWTCTLVEPALPDGPLELRVTVDLDRLRFAWRAGAIGEWQTVSTDLDASILSDEVTCAGLPNFTGAFVGMACQDMSGAGIHADFAWFRYEGQDAGDPHPARIA